MSEETKQNEGQDQSELSDDQLEQAAGGAQTTHRDDPELQLNKEEVAKEISGPAEVVGTNFEEIKVTYTEFKKG